MTESVTRRREHPDGRVSALADRRFWWFVGAAVVVGLALRVAWVWWVAREPVFPYDTARYIGYAREIGAGRGYTEPITGEATAYYPPGYPWFLGIVAWLARHTPLTDDLPLLAGLVQAVIGATTAAAGAVVARRLAGPIAGIVAAVGLALYPNLVFHSGTILGETLYNGLFLAFLAVLLSGRVDATTAPRLVDNDDEGAGDAGGRGRDVLATSTPRLAAAALLLGLAVMVRPISLVLVPVLAAVWWADTHDLRVAVRRTGLVVLVLVAVIAPWTVRNAVRMDAFVPLSTNTGENLCIGHAPEATGAFTVTSDCDVEDGVQFGSASEVRADDAKVKLGLRYLRENLGREPGLLWKRIHVTYVRDGDHDGVVAVQSYRVDRWMAIPTEARLFRLADVAYWVVSALGVVGLIWLALRRRADGVLLVAAALATAIVPMAFFGDSRFKVPVLPLLIIAAACAPTLALAGRRTVDRHAAPA